MPVILDGYGNHDSAAIEARCEEIIESPWADRLVRAIVTYPRDDLEDLAQEARLAMWKAAGGWDGQGSLEGYLHQQARWKVLSLLSGEHCFTGQERRRAVSQRRGDASRQRLRDAVAAFKQRRHREPSVGELAEELGIHPATVRKQMRTMTRTPLAVSTHVDSLNALIEAYGTEAVIGLADQFDAVLLAYHHGEIHQAVAELDPLWREYVYLRFWLGVGDSEIARTLGTRVHWSSGVKPRLAERLAHLATVT